MKKILLLISLLACNLAHATILRIGSDGYVTVDGQNYQRSGSSTYYLFRPTDSTVQLSLFGAGKIAGQPYTAFYDGDNSNTQFTSMAALQTWLNAYFEPDAVGLSTLADSCAAIRDDMSGSSGTVTSTSSGNLSPLFTTSVATATTTPAISYSLSNATAYTVLTNSANATAAPSYAKVDPLALKNNGGTASSSTYYRGDGQWATPAGGSVDSSMLIFYTQISLSSAQLLSLNTTPVELIAAPGAGKYIVPINMTFDYTYGTATYSSSIVQTYETSDKSGPITSNSTFLGFTASIIRGLYTTGAAGASTITYAENQPLMIWVSGSNPTTGDGTAKVNIYYKIVTQ